jgi:hypothetical protein
METVNGTGRNDHLRGTAFSDTIRGVRHATVSELDE